VLFPSSPHRPLDPNFSQSLSPSLVKLLTVPQHTASLLVSPPLLVPVRDSWLMRASVEAMVTEKLAGNQGGAQPTGLAPL
jgi:hypothetical protein